MTESALKFITELHPLDDIHLTECRHYPNNGWMVHYSRRNAGRDWMDEIAFLEPAGQTGRLGLRWSHRMERVTAKPKPVGPEENIGSCEPGPDMRTPLWDKSGKTWFTDVDKVGRYSIQRPAPRQPWQAFLNGRLLTGVESSTDPEMIKRAINRRILEARRINAIDDKPAAGSPGPELLAKQFTR